jgi:NAD(P)-dependent dehydrogenase (short-subunit alcohol dehydrogenase family)
VPSVLITGAAKGLGRELSRSFANHKWDLYLVIRSAELEAHLRNEFPEAKILISDVRGPEHERNLNSWLGSCSLDVLINNAGVGSKGSSLENATAEQLSKVFETNCVGVFSTVKGAYHSLMRSENGLIINISSRRGSLSMQAAGASKGSGCSYSYRISKAAQNMLTLCLADDLEEVGIAVAAIHPGRLLTEMASTDAHMTPEKSAGLISDLVINNRIKNRDYLCMETGTLQW